MKTKSLVLASILVMVANIAVQAQTFTPIPLTSNSFTQEIIVPNDWPYRLNAQSVSVTIDKGPALQTNNAAGFPTYYSLQSGDTFFEIGLDRGSGTTGFGLPHGGSLLTNVTLTSHIYQLPYWTNWNSNCLCIGPWTNGMTYDAQPLTGGPYVGQSYYTNVNLTLNNSTAYTALSFLCTGGGPDVEVVTISYADGTVQSNVLFCVPNWFVNASTYTDSGTGTPTDSYAFTADARFNPAENQNAFANTGVTSGSRLWSADIALNNTNSYPTNLSFSTTASSTAGHASVIIAVSGSINPNDNIHIPNTTTLTGPFNPVSVSGFNAGFVVANAPANATGLAPLTATMDDGTNLGAANNTFFEQGYDRAAPQNGFPVHNTIITSVANTNRTYQMAPTYYQPMSVLIDTNHQLANITPQNPASYVAFSLLTAGGNVGGNNVMTNYIILQHTDGVNESNLFYGYDWFNNTIPYAWSANERVSLGTTTSTAGRPVQNLNSGDPRLFESEFQMQDPTPVTNIVLGFVRSPAVTATTYVIAVSATTNFIPPVVATNTTVQNVYAGQVANYSVSLAFGSFPSYQWQFTDGQTFTNNLNNGPTGTGSYIFGATTPNLTVSNVSSSDVGFYTCHISNPIPSSTNSTLAPLMLLVSTLANMAQPGDVINDQSSNLPTILPGSNSAPDPAGQGPTNAIDGTLAKWLNFGYLGGQNTSTSPFQGPVVLYWSPAAGQTTISAMRFVTAGDNPQRDPVDYEIEGSEDGTNYTFISSGSLSLFDLRNPAAGAIDLTNDVLQEVDFSNTNAYYTYRVTFQNAKNEVGGVATNANSLQLGEIEFLGTQVATAPPRISLQPSPSAVSLYAASNANVFSVSVVAAGPGPLSYQWNYNGSPIPNATTTAYTLANIPPSAQGNYTVTVSNANGSVTSSPVALTVLTTPSIVTQPVPTNQILYAGGSFTISGESVVGPAPFSYQWYFNNGAILGATNVSYTLTGATTNNSGSYYVAVSSQYPSSTTNSSAVNLTVLPLSSLSHYSQTILADNPIGYWRLDEEPDDTFGDDGVVANDYIGGHDGIYTNAVIDVSGYSTNDTDTAASFGTQNTNLSRVFGITGIDFTQPTNQNGEFSVECWVKSYQTNQVSGAGIVSKGLGNGGEQFTLDTGAANLGYRFYFRGNTNNSSAFGLTNNPAIDANSTVPSQDLNWHHLVGVLDGVNSNISIYVDGVLSGRTVMAHAGWGVQSGDASQIVFGARSQQQTNAFIPNFQYRGTIDEVAIYNYALTSNQVAAHYYSAGITPVFTQEPQSVTNSQGTTATLSGEASGTPTLFYQWYDSDGSNPTTPIAGATNTSLVFADVQPSAQGYYQLVVSNSLGVADSTPVYLTISSGPPIFQTDLQPAYDVLYGASLSMTVSVGGTPPFSYQWTYNGTNLSDGGGISGATSSNIVINNMTFSDDGVYQVIVSNGPGTTPSTAATVTVVPIVTFDGSGLGWGQNATAGSGLPIFNPIGGSNAVELTQNIGSQASSTFFGSPVYIGAFRASYTYQFVNAGTDSNPADGVAFVVQNDARGASALGGDGGSLGYSGITNSAALEFNIYHGGAPTVGISLDTNGVIGPFQTPLPVLIDSGDPINVTITYANGVADVLLQDAVNQETFAATEDINLPAVVKGDTAYVGFTGGDGGSESTQTVSNFVFTSIVQLSATPNNSGNLVLTWPTGVGAYMLQESPSILPASWSNVTNSVVSVGSTNEVIVTPVGGQAFYQLKLSE